jgi:hypothetical protein
MGVGTDENLSIRRWSWHVGFLLLQAGKSRQVPLTPSVQHGVVVKPYIDCQVCRVKLMFWMNFDVYNTRRTNPRANPRERVPTRFPTRTPKGSAGWEGT